ncbi:GDSL esterase/lipase EXL3 [Dissostichus eleginoides]|uniref:GDSL esterase/lipase EXL3 n=1 Tax=Dissostichus eleginoides TaxID=100907 RepID=A0AAD9BRJ7_DISEL|nr:GDSL esterase/lipase EXL3 [Dissostichus eleginoides]
MAHMERTFGFSEKCPNPRRVCYGERHREEGEAIPGNPLCPAPSGAPSLGCSPGYRALGGGEGRNTAAEDVYPGSRTSMFPGPCHYNTHQQR